VSAPSIPPPRRPQAPFSQLASYRWVVEGASDLIQVVSASDQLEFVNPAWCEALGYSPEQAEGLMIWDVLAERAHAAWRSARAALEESDVARRVELVFRARGGREIEVEGGVSSHREDGQLVVLMGIFRDIGEHRHVERMKREFLATVSHELRTPLTSVLGSLGLLRTGRLADRPDKTRELLEIAERNGERLLKLINDLLDLQRLEAGELRFVLAPTPLASVVQDASHGISGLAEQFRIRVYAEPLAGDLVVLTDRERLNQVLYNLLSNAIKFSPAGESVELLHRVRDRAIDLIVRDHGPGIPESFRPRLFEAFAQADTPRRLTGTGLGLSISKRLVEALGGTIALESESGEERHGTVVTVSLPRLGGRRVAPEM
jgi:PAS domain S-box-containing protein